jgi:hypothetical protein
MDILAIQKMVERDGIIFLTYGGFLSQTLISSMTEALEEEAQRNEISIGVSNNIFTVFIELSQNMMNYSKSKDEFCRKIMPEGLIVVSREDDNLYFVESQNIISIDDKNKIEPIINEIQSLDREALKKRYRELRKSGQRSHNKGGGIGFYEIAKRCDSMEFTITKINDDKYYFHVKTTIINIKKDA